MFEGPLAEKTETVKVKYLLLWSGEEGIEISSTWDLSNTESNTLSVYWERFEKYVAPKSNFRIDRYKLRSLKQDNGESVDAFMKNVRLLARECKYENTNEHILDTLIFGTNSEHVQSKLIQRDETLTLDEAIDVARTAEATKQQLNSIQAESAIHAISNDRQQAKRRPWQYANHRGTPRDGRYSRNTEYSAKPEQQHKSGHCGHCGRKCSRFYNTLNECPAYGCMCRCCGKANHWQTMCLANNNGTKSPRSTGSMHQDVHALESGPDADVSEIYFHQLEINTLGEDTDNTSTQALVQLTVKSTQCTKQLTCKIDTGAEGNVIPLATYKHVSPYSDLNQDGIPTDLNPSNMRVTAYGGHTVMQYGTGKLSLTHRGTSELSTFHVVKSGGPAIIGLPTCRTLKLVTLNYSIDVGMSAEQQTETTAPISAYTPRPQGDESAKASILKQYADVFDGIGCFEGEYHVTLDPTPHAECR